MSLHSDTLDRTSPQVDMSLHSDTLDRMMKNSNKVISDKFASLFVLHQHCLIHHSQNIYTTSLLNRLVGNSPGLYFSQTI